LKKYCGVKGFFMEELQIVGQPLPRPDASDKALGKTLYVDDISLPSMLYAAIYYSPLPHALIKSISTSKASSLTGVFAILTAADIQGKNFIPLIKHDWSFLAEKMVIYPGEPVAVIVAETKDILEAARNAILVEYEELSPVFDPEESLQPDAPQINPEGNLIAHHKIRSGNPEAGFKASDVIVEGVYETGYQEHAYLEPQGMLAVPGPQGTMEVWGSMQCPFYVLNAVCSILGLPNNKVRILQTPTGGAFGGKEDVPSPIAGLAALAAWKTKRPVKLILDRHDDIILSSKRHPSRCYYRTGAKKDGTLTACEIKIYLDAGAYATLTPAVLWRCAVHSYGPYRIPNVKVDAFAGATNKVPCGAFRGFGTPKVVFAMERQMDKIAGILGIDPIELRMKNALRTGDRTSTGQSLPWSVGITETLEKAKATSHWNEKRKNYPLIIGAKRRGIGCSALIYGVGLGAAGKAMDVAGAYVQVKPDGSVLFAVGTTDMGQGMQTVLTQITAEGLGGISPEHVRMLPVDTMQVGDSGPTVASRATYVSGNALLNACKKIINDLKSVAATMLKCEPENISITGGHFSSDSTSEKMYLTFEDVAAACAAQHISLTQHGYFVSPPTSWDPETGQGKAYVTYSYATQIAEVEVDMETGEVNVLDMWAVHDVGKAINPQAAYGQIEGGLIQGMGYALSEFITMDGKGRIQNPSFSTYIIPTSKDTPHLHAELVESPYPEGPFGAKGFGETPLMGAAACIANAVANATGVDITQLPILPERLLTDIQSIKSRLLSISSKTEY